MASQVTWEDLESREDPVHKLHQWCWPFDIDPRIVLKLYDQGKGHDLAMLIDDYSWKAITIDPDRGLPDRYRLDTKASGIGVPVGIPEDREPEFEVHHFRWDTHQHAATLLEKLIDTNERFGLHEAWRKSAMATAYRTAVRRLVKSGAPVGDALNRASSGNIMILILALFYAGRVKDIRWSPDMLYEFVLDQYVVDGDGDPNMFNDEFFLLWQMTLARNKRKQCASWRVAHPSDEEMCIVRHHAISRVSRKPQIEDDIVQIMLAIGASIRSSYDQAMQWIEELVQRVKARLAQAREQLENFEPEYSDPEEQEWYGEPVPQYPREAEIAVRKLEHVCKVWLEGLRRREAQHIQYQNMRKLLDPLSKELSPAIAAYAVGVCACTKCSFSSRVPK